MEDAVDTPGTAHPAVAAALNMLDKYVKCEWPEPDEIAQASQVAADLENHVNALGNMDTLVKQLEAERTHIQERHLAEQTKLDALIAKTDDKMSESALYERVGAVEAIVLSLQSKLERSTEEVSGLRTELAECKHRMSKLEADNMTLKEKISDIRFSVGK